MSLGTVLILVGLGLVGLVFIMFPEARSLFKGFTRLFIQDMASTPEGAKALYTEKIDELTETYREASDSYRMVSGEYEESKKELESLQKRLKRVEEQCENFVRNGNDEHALIKAQERQEIIEDIQRVGNKMDAYKQAADEAKEMSSMCEQQLQQMKREMRDTIQSMEDNKRITEVYQRMDKLRASSGTDKMLTAIREKNENLAKMASGSRAVYQNSNAAKVAKVEKDSLRMESNAYLNSLKHKYSTGAKAIETGTNQKPFNAYLEEKHKYPKYEERK